MTQGTGWIVRRTHPNARIVHRLDPGRLRTRPASTTPQTWRHGTNPASSPRCFGGRMSQDAVPSQWFLDGFRLLVEGLTDPALMVVDPSGNVVCWNLGAEQLLGWRSHEVLGQALLELAPGTTSLEPPLRDE